MSARHPRILLLAGLEPTGRAGLLADVATVRALGGDPVGIATALTAQGTRTFAREAVSPAMLRQQLSAALELGPVDAVKLGMVVDRAQLQAIRRALAKVDAPWVVDPVVRSSKGEALSGLTARDYLQLAGERVVITPNLAEAAWLLGLAAPETSLGFAEEAAGLVAAQGFLGAVVKGGHLEGGPTDLLASAGVLTRLSGRRLARAAATRGTGCRFASALATALGQGEPLDRAVRVARGFVRGYLRTARSG